MAGLQLDNYCDVNKNKEIDIFTKNKNSVFTSTGEASYGTGSLLTGKDNQKYIIY